MVDSIVVTELLLVSFRLFGGDEEELLAIAFWCIKQPANLITYLQIKNEFSVKKCQLPRCKCCEILIPYHNFYRHNNINIQINKDGKCNTPNVIYLIICNCKKTYVGQTTNNFNVRLNLHRSHTNNPKNAILPANIHLNKCGNKYNATILYVSEKNDEIYLSAMEEYFKSIIKPELNAM